MFGDKREYNGYDRIILPTITPKSITH